jgi:hypothetical protein
VDATAGLLAGFPVAAQSAVLPLPRRNGEQVSLEKYAEQMLSCQDPDKIVRTWYGLFLTNEEAAALHQMPGVSEKLRWARENQTPIFSHIPPKKW